MRFFPIVAIAASFLAVTRARPLIEARADEAEAEVCSKLKCGSTVTANLLPCHLLAIKALDGVAFDKFVALGCAAFTADFFINMPDTCKPCFQPIIAAAKKIASPVVKPVVDKACALGKCVLNSAPVKACVGAFCKLTGIGQQQPAPPVLPVSAPELPPIRPVSPLAPVPAVQRPSRIPRPVQRPGAAGSTTPGSQLPVVIPPPNFGTGDSTSSGASSGGSRSSSPVAQRRPVRARPGSSASVRSSTSGRRISSASTSRRVSTGIRPASPRIARPASAVRRPSVPRELVSFLSEDTF